MLVLRNCPGTGDYLEVFFNEYEAKRIYRLLDHTHPSFRDG